MRKKWIHRATALLCVCALAAGLGAGWRMSGAAAEEIDLERPCALTVNAGGEDLAEDLAGAHVVIDVYKVADAVKSQGYDSYTFAVRNAFSSLKITPETDSEGWRALAGAAAEIALGVGAAADDASGAVGDAGAGALGQGIVADVTANAGTSITKMADGTPLGSGLYLLIARGSDVEDYVRMVADDAGNETVVTVAQSERHVYTFAPELVALPGKAADDSGAVNTANPGEWLYDLTVQMKPEQSLRMGQLEIVKTLLSYETSAPATFVFHVEAVLDGEKVYDQVVSVTFTTAGEERILIDDIPVGAEVTVTEVYSGASYELTTDGTQRTVIAAEDTAEVGFTNTYNRKKRTGYGITNHFTYGEDGWQWEQWEETAE